MAKAYTDPGPITFRARINGNPEVGNASSYVDFPHDLRELYGAGNLVPVRVVFDGTVHYQGSLAKMGGPLPVLIVRKDVQEQLGKQAGDSVDVEVRLDDRPRTVEVPGDLAGALGAAGARDAFDQLAYSHRKEFVRWIGEAKRPETRLRRIGRTCEMVLAGEHRN